MAVRPIFLPSVEGDDLIKKIDIEFEWFPGFSISQKRKSIESLHDKASKKGYNPILEISTKSAEKIGVSLSAFNLIIKFKNGFNASVEQVFQGSKVFEKGGPYIDFFDMTGPQIKKDERLKNSGKLIGFSLFGMQWELKPKTAFYDWIYIHALNQSTTLKNEILDYNSFSDIEFNPKKSINCQARSAALYVSLYKRNLLDKALTGRDNYLKIITKNNINEVDDIVSEEKLNYSQMDLFA